MRQYSRGFKEKILHRITGPNAVPVSEVADEFGINHNVVYRWRQRARERGEVSNETRGDRPEDRPSSEKLRLVMEASSLSEEELGEFLRRNGLHDAQLIQWREKILGSLDTKSNSKTSEVARYKRMIKELEREVRRKDKALAEVTALLALKKKLELLWGEGEDDTDPKREGES